MNSQSIWRSRAEAFFPFIGKRFSSLDERLRHQPASGSSDRPEVAEKLKFRESTFISRNTATQVLADKRGACERPSRQTFLARLSICLLHLSLHPSRLLLHCTGVHARGMTVCNQGHVPRTCSTCSRTRVLPELATFRSREKYSVVRSVATDSSIRVIG